MKWIINEIERRAGRETLSTRLTFTQSDVRKSLQAVLEQGNNRLCWSESELRDELLIHLPCVRSMGESFRQKLSKWALEVAVAHNWVYRSQVVTDDSNLFVDIRVKDVRPGPKRRKQNL